MKNELFLCECNSIEHQLTFSYDEEECEVFVSIHLVPDTFWKRVKNGIKYIFGHRSIYGDFDEFILKRKDADRLQEIVNYLRS